MRHVEEACAYCGGAGKVLVCHFDDAWEQWAAHFMEQHKVDPKTEAGQRMARKLAEMMRRIDQGKSMPWETEQ